MDWKEAKTVVEEIKRRTERKAYSLVIDKERQPDLFDSKFGGLPYWDLEKEYPLDSEEKKLMLLAQINLERMFQEVEDDGVLPETGMLQFFIALDDVYGMDFDEPDVQKNFRVVYHEKVNYEVTEAQVRSLHIPVCTDEDFEEYSPIWKEASIKFIRKNVYMGEGDYRFSMLFNQIQKEKFGERYEEQSVYQLLDEEAYDNMLEELSNERHWLTGYPYFTQTDPREYEEKYQYYDTLLFQMDSDYGDDKGEDYIMWGDAGVANFFINQKDLEKRDFSRILYNWDCC